jgi:peptide/nickel transport system substrate-binding protein
MYNGLVELGPDLEPVPELAESWDVEQDGALYRFHLRDSVTWHDGQPFDSADVKYTFEQVLLQYHSRTKASVGPVLESITTPDARTVEFRFTQPYSPLLRQLDVTEAPILPEHIYAGTDPQRNPANESPVGTGPFTFASYQPGSELRMVRNEDYFKPELPYFDEVVMRVIPDETSQVNALLAGEVDWLFGAPGPELEALRANPDLDTLQTSINPGGANCIMTVSFNLERPMFTDVRVRQAVASALDRQEFLDRVLFGQGKVAAAPISSGLQPAHAEDLEGMPTFDRGRAERLLDQAGWVRQGPDGARVAQGVAGVPDGTPLAFDLLHFPTFNQYGELFRAQLAEVGIDVTLQPLDPPVFADTVFVQRDFDTNIISYCNATDPQVGVRRMYVTSNIAPIPFSNSSAYSNPRVDQLFDVARGTVDPQQRAATYRQLQEVLVDDLPYMWVVETTSTRVFRTECQGFGPSGHFAETAFCTR